MLKIQITYKWMHPHYGGERTEVKTFDMKDGEKAQEYYEIKNRGLSEYEHVYIDIIHEK